jgi:hypothetical protein
MRFELGGTEVVTFELRGSLAAAEARRLAAPAGLDPELREDGRAVVSLLLLEMRGLGLRGVPGPRFDYGEALWRLGVVRAGRASWLGIACDLDHPLVRWTGARLIRYPVRAAAFAFEAWTARVTTEAGALLVSAPPADEEAPVEPPRPLLVHDGARLYRIPWDEEPAPFRRHAQATVSGDLATATLGASLRWEAAAVVHRGRGHRCGLAGRVGA